ncbi:MAG: cobamide remodeling phosphodiesterase CbiR [Desulfovibrionaceae bacterium]
MDYASLCATSPWNVAAPSFVRPGTVADNCRFLAGRVREVGVVLFETAGSLAYTETDLPPDLAALPLTYHVHLPLDLPWRSQADGAGAAWDVVRQLVAKTAYLAPNAFVLHPPPADMGPDAATALERFASLWRDAGLDPARLLVENTEENDLAALAAVLDRSGCGVCLDIGHCMAYGQQALLACGGPLGWDRVGMLHLCGVDARGRHMALDHPDSVVPLAAVRRMLEAAPHTARVMLEVFSWDAVAASASCLAMLADNSEKA